MGGEAAELAVVIAQAVGHAVALVVAGILSLTFYKRSANIESSSP